MLCPDILTAEDYRILLSTQDRAIVMANYQQEPIDVQGRLYTGFRTYSEVPALSRVLAYCDRRRRDLARDSDTRQDDNVARLGEPLYLSQHNFQKIFRNFHSIILLLRNGNSDHRCCGGRRKSFYSHKLFEYIPLRRVCKCLTCKRIRIACRMYSRICRLGAIL